jgi:hypothetical protein
METKDTKLIRWFYHGMNESERKNYIRWRAWNELTKWNKEFILIMPEIEGY